MDDLIAFYRARLDERAARAEHFHDGETCAAHNDYSWDYLYLPKDCDCGEPERLLADVAAKRELVTVWEATQHDGERPHPLTTRLPVLLAAEFAGHPDYREEWRP